jgi:type III pantothenate kinase
MILCLDVGNTQIYGGLFVEGELRLSFRKISKSGDSSDEIGLFLRSVLRENGFDPNQVEKIGFCTVVPDIVHSLKNACSKYFNINPFSLGPGSKTGLKIKYRNPVEVGADRIANSIAAINRHPNRNILIVDFGTATTFCAVSKNRDYLGGAIIAGLRISMEALEERTAKLPTVEIIKPKGPIGRSTVESIQSGLYYGYLGSVREISGRFIADSFGKESPIILGTGGFANLFKDEKLFDEIIPDLVLQGIFESIKMNM